ncbi:cupin domain-containing protein [Desulfogranum marinum]|uniref:cupin domain-containing protein n=1 Tax=Desulfogranum marinum TaxID=453220 RepID=UPI0029C68C63|nr:cupin domain-containing protein [Desulfogranum marinum]
MEDRQLLGKNLKQLRKYQKLTLKQVADMANCSESLLSKVENGRGNPSLNTLHAIASAVGTDIGTLFMQNVLHAEIVSRKGERLVTQIAGGQGNGVSLEYLSPHKPHNILQAHVQIVDPGGGSTGEITHEGEEMGYVLEGILKLTIDNDIYILHEGDSFFFDSSLPHKFFNPGATVARIIWVNTPPTF